MARQVTDSDDAEQASELNENAATEPDAAEPSDADPTRTRIRVLAIFLLGIGVYALIGTGLDAGGLLLNNLTTYFVSGGVVLAIGLLLLVLAR